MALYYQTEYRLGRRCGRITRSYTGFQAFLAIVLDLVFGLFFELITGAIGLALRLICLTVQIGFAFVRLSWSTLVAVTAALVSLLTLPFVALHHAVDRLRSRIEADRCRSYPASTIKPEWALNREV
jgi:hypothetical protein